jgi:RNA polymerase sigma-70 factor (ECF subfamily)
MLPDSLHSGEIMQNTRPPDFAKLLQHTCDRLRRLARVMLRGFPLVRRWEETDDILQNTLLRLCQALRVVRPESEEAFVRLAGRHLRYALLDLARHYGGPQGLGSNHASHGPGDDTADLVPLYDKADHAEDPGLLALWTDFHLAVEALPEKERQVVEVIWYQGATKAEAARLLDLPLWTVKFRWQAARLKISQSIPAESLWREESSAVAWSALRN